MASSNLPDDVCRFEVIRLEVPGEPIKVLFEGVAPMANATKQFAKATLDFHQNEAAKHRTLFPEAVRLLDNAEREFLRYTWLQETE